MLGAPLGLPMLVRNPRLLPFFKFLLNAILWATVFPAIGQVAENRVTVLHGAITRGDQTKKQLALVFTGHEYAEGGDYILESLKKHRVKASFFFTGDFYRNVAFRELIKKAKNQGHYLGAHSDRHLLYCSWENRDSLLVSKTEFVEDLGRNYELMQHFGIERQQAHYYLPPYEWYNDSISHWTSKMGFQLVNFTPGTRSNADYTSPEMANYIGSEAILESILAKEEKEGLNGFILLMHIGVGPARADKFYRKLPELIEIVKTKGYKLVTIDELLDPLDSP